MPDLAWVVGFLKELEARCLEDNNLDAHAFKWGIEKRLELRGPVAESLIPMMLTRSADLGADVVCELERLLHEPEEANGMLVQKLWEAIEAQQVADYRLHEARSIWKSLE